MTDSAFAAAIGAAAQSGRLNVENTWVSRRWRYFYMAINKAASSKIKMVLHQLEGYPLPADPFEVHARIQPGIAFVGKLPVLGGDAVEISTGPDWRRFAFVRNPYARLYSAYENKIADLASPYVGVRRGLRAPDEFHGGLDAMVGASSRLPAAQVYDAALAQLVHETYQADFATLDYARDSWRDIV